MNTILTTFWVTKAYKVDGNEFKFFMGLSEINMLNALVASIGTATMNDLDLTEESSERWTAIGKDGTPLEGIHFLVEKRHDCPPTPVRHFSIWDNRIEAHLVVQKKPLPKQLTFL